ncbi:hypothetical protein WN51_03862 [Melipona quadrifasciata]|uniref:Uncharacterized protein n=1 Tax=Melipona quadrifasciata TaxID=166423 RepID=A0A0M9AB06_9HYME|nr:hypothetical protein WN51_03862 [Melipona quadrifasciata]
MTGYQSKNGQLLESLDENCLRGYNTDCEIKIKTTQSKKDIFFLFIQTYVASSPIFVPHLTINELPFMMKTMKIEKERVALKSRHKLNIIECLREKARNIILEKCAISESVLDIEDEKTARLVHQYDSISARRARLREVSRRCLKLQDLFSYIRADIRKSAHVEKESQYDVRDSVTKNSTTKGEIG